MSFEGGLPNLRVLVVSLIYDDISAWQFDETEKIVTVHDPGEEDFLNVADGASSIWTMGEVLLARRRNKLPMV